jgi:lantibiotic biosynthesis protein
MKYQFFSSLLIRNPVFSFADYGQLDYGKIIQDDFFKMALYAASVNFYNGIQKKNFEYEALSPAQKNTIKKYCNRACFRPTPFGAFSSVSALKWSEESNRVNFPPQQFKVHLKVDYFSSLELCEKLVSNEGKDVVLYKSNSSFYKVFRYLRYIKYDLESPNNRRLFSIISLAKNKFIVDIIEFCAIGKSVGEIVLFLKTKTGLSAPEIGLFINQLISEQIILPQSGNSITGDDCLEELVRLLNENNIHSAQLEKVEFIVENLGMTGNSGVKNVVESANLLYEMLQAPQELKSPFYVVTEREPATGGLHVKYQQAIQDALYCIDKLVPAYEPGSLDNFKKGFMEKFENREVPLLLALDPEMGVGYENLDDVFKQDWLLKGIEFEQSQPFGEKQIKWTEGHSFLLNKMLQQAVTDTPHVLELTKEEIDSLGTEEYFFDLPPTISVIFRILKDKVFIESAGGVSATTLISRFSPFNDSFHEMAKEIARKEQETNQQVVFAEIAHICDVHAANINRRRHIRDFEIPIMVMSTMDEASQILLSDLYVTVTGGNQVILTSKSLNTRVIPRLSSAFNYVKSEFSVFRFLCDLQSQGLKTNFKLDLTAFYPGLRFYPRVVYKSAILSLASWQLEAKDVDFIKNSTPEECYAAFVSLAAAIRLPRHFALIQHDNYLVFDTSSKDDIALFLDTVKSYTKITLQEFILDDDGHTVVETGATEKPLIGQFITSLYHNEDVYSLYGGQVIEKGGAEKQSLSKAPGWLYYKIYCHPVGSNELLRNTILPLVNELIKTSRVYKWFFVRYKDPDYHIRFRLHVADDCMNEVTAIVSNSLQRAVDKRVIDKYYTDSYIRELERYSARLIKEVEQFFFRSSDLVVTYIKKHASSDTGGVFIYDLDIILLSVDEICNAFGLTIDEKVAQLQNLYENFYNEMGGGKELKKGLDKKYTDLRAEITDTCSKLYRIKKKYGKTAVQFYESCRKLAEKTRKINYPNVQKIIGDIIHMHLNRLFLQNSRKYELIIYYLMYKHYTGLYFKSKSVAG